MLSVLVLLAVISCALYGTVAALSRRFHYDAPETERPIVWVVALFGAAFLVYLIAIWVAVRAKQDRWLLAAILVSSLAYRVTLLPSTPIQEIDIYRYLWDGAVLSVGVSPFRYSPQQVRDAFAEERLEKDLARLVRLRDSDRSLVTILDRIHYPQVPTVYPPVSQVVFATAALTTPDSATVECRLIVIKVWLVAFDMLTLVLVVGLLRLTGRPTGLSVVYGWCPLLMKEFANSGHLDAIAVFLVTLLAYLLARLCLSKGRNGTKIAIASGVCLALGVGAKLYPIVLAPLLAVCVARHVGWWMSAAMMLVFVAIVMVVLWPMAPPMLQSDTHQAASAPIEDGGAAIATHADAGDPSLGLKTFLRRWEMNDFIFLLLIENLKPADAIPPNQTAWFSVAPESFREEVISLVTTGPDGDRWQASFYVARGATALAFLVLAGWFSWRAYPATDTSVWLRYLFLTLAWFWLLSPTQNPWYWTWVLPLLPFARSRVWLAMSGLVLLYYLRFWLGYHFSDEPVLGTAYHGTVFFDLVVTWFEYAPWFVCLTVACIWSRWKRAGQGRGAN